MYPELRATTLRFTPVSRRRLQAIFSSLVALLLLATITSSVQAGPVYSGSRSTSSPGQLVSNLGWAANDGGFKILFSVTQIGDYWTYDYWFKNADNSKPLDPGICGFLEIEVSKVKDSWYKLVSDGSTNNYLSGQWINLAPQNLNHHLWDAPQSDPTYGMYAVYIGKDKGTTGELNDGHITIVSSQAPKWGSFYARAGDNITQVKNRGANLGVFPDPNGNMLSSVGLPPVFDPTQDLNGSSVKKWILVPDTMKIVPEPTTVLLAGQAMVAGLYLVRRRYRAGRATT